jgi:hypothetical protein
MTGRKGGIWARLLNAGCVDEAAWRDAYRNRQYVGTCPDCGSPLRPGQQYFVRAVAWYPVDCSVGGCDYSAAAHGPRPDKAKRE